MRPTKFVISAGRRRALVGAVVAVLFFASSTLFLYERRREDQILQSALGAQAGIRAHNFLKEIEEHLDTLSLLADWSRRELQAGRGVDSGSFPALARILQSRNTDLFLLAFAVRSPPPSDRSSGPGPGDTGTAAYRVEWVEPPGVRPLTAGTDLATHPIFARLVAGVARTGRLGVSSRVPCPEKEEEDYDVWLLQPLMRQQYEGGVPEGGEPPAGMLVVVLDIADIMERALGAFAPEDLSWRLVDEDAPPGEQVLFSSGGSAAPNDGGPVWRTGVQLSAEKSWTLSARPGPAFLAGHARRNALPMLLGGLAFALLVGALLTALLGRTEQVESEVRERTERLSREIAEREEAQARLRESEGRYRALAENAEDLIYVAGLDERIAYANAYAARCAGVPPAALVGVPVAVFTPRTSKEELAGVMQEILAGRTVKRPFPAVLQGREVWLDLNLVPLRNDAGEVTGVLGIARDVTERKKMEEELRRAKESAEEAARAKADFLATMSHEIRTPLNGIIGTVGLLFDGPLPERQRELAAIAHESATILLALINDILDFSKIEARKLTLEPVAFDPAHLLDEVAALFAANAAARGIELVVSPAAAPPRLVGDAGRIRQVLMNFVGNAVKFTDRGRVRIGLTPDGETGGVEGWRFSVEDSGCGIPEERQQQIFERFVQGDPSTTRRYGGTGLGLAISRRLVELMGGTIGVESRPGAGATFWFRLPLHRDLKPHPAVPSGAAATQPAAAPGAPCPVRAGRPPRVLVVEDNAINQRVAVLMLESLGCRADVAANGREAVVMVEGFAYDLVLMDCEMPEMDGFEAAREIRRREAGSGRRLRIVAMTARAGQGERERCRAAGMDDYLGKPVSPRQLAALLGSREPQPEDGSGATPAAIDPRKVEELRRICGSRERWEHLAGLFESGAGDLLTRLRTAAASGDAGELRTAAHKLKGSCANFGARTMAELCGRISEGARNGERCVDALVADLEKEWANVRSALDEQRRQGMGGL